MKPRSSSRKAVNYSKIYSDSSDDTEETTKLRVKVNDFVVVKVFGRKDSYKLYIACVSKCLDQGYQVKIYEKVY